MNKPSSIVQATVWNARLKSNEYRQRRLPFGKYVGTMIQDLPYSYLRWGTINFRDHWAEMFAREMQHRNPKLR